MHEIHSTLLSKQCNPAQLSLPMSEFSHIPTHLFTSNPIITLAPNSLYIATNQIIAAIGKFHWSFYVTDNSGFATKYHRAVLSSKEERAEGLVILPIDPVTTYSLYDPGVVMFAYFRIKVFIPPSPDIFRSILGNGFDPPHTLGYATVIENRKMGLTCRTWAMSIYYKLRAAGYINRDEGRKIEDIITRKSIETEEKVARGEFEISEVIEI